MRTYKKPEIKITKFSVEDVITTSVVVTPDIDGGSTSFPKDWEQQADTTAAGLLSE